MEHFLSSAINCISSCLTTGRPPFTPKFRIFFGNKLTVVGTVPNKFNNITLKTWAIEWESVLYTLEKAAGYTRKKRWLFCSTNNDGSHCVFSGALSIPSDMNDEEAIISAFKEEFAKNDRVTFDFSQI